MNKMAQETAGRSQRPRKLNGKHNHQARLRSADQPGRLTPTTDVAKTVRRYHIQCAKRQALLAKLKAPDNGLSPECAATLTGFIAAAAGVGGAEDASSGRTGKRVGYSLPARLGSRLRRLAKRLGTTEDRIVREAISDLVSSAESDCDVSRTVAFAVGARGSAMITAEQRQTFSGMNLDALDRAGIQVSGSPITILLRCLRCGDKWSPNIQPGGRFPHNWWRCPNLCNQDHPALK
jgi:predicted DNA-binding protein